MEMETETQTFPHFHLIDYMQYAKPTKALF